MLELSPESPKMTSEPICKLVNNIETMYNLHVFNLFLSFQLIACGLWGNFIRYNFNCSNLPSQVQDAIELLLKTV